MKEPRLRNVEKVKPPYELNKFPKDVILKIAEDIVYLLATRGEPRLEGPDWEKIFANSIGAQWTPSNIGLDDVVLGNCAWGAKTVKNTLPSKAKKVRLISGRNAPEYSFPGAAKKRTGGDPEVLGSQVLAIWNERVSSIRKRFKHARNVVLIKSNDLTELAVFEFETLRFEPEKISWQWNERNNLEGYLDSVEHKFTWQPHGAQFTIIEDVPPNRIAFKIRKPSQVSKAGVLKEVGFNESWVKILPPRKD